MKVGQQLRIRTILTNTISNGEEDSLLGRDLGLKPLDPEDRGNQVAGESSRMRG